MNIEQKLILSERSDAIYFIKEGVFAQLFGVSLYLAVTQLNLDVKVCGHYYKRLNNQLVLRAGLPVSTLIQRYSGLVSQRFGYRLKGDWQFNQIDYQHWYKTQLNLQSLILINNNTYFQANVIAQTQHVNGKFLLLTDQEYAFLDGWQQNQFTSSAETAFIQGLKHRLIIKPQ